MSIKKLMLVSANRHAEPYPVYPLGISYLNTHLSGEIPEIEIDVIDLMLICDEEYILRLKEFQPDFVGISLRNIDDVNIYKKESFIEHYKKIITYTRKYSKASVIIGGSGFSLYPKLLFETLEPDFGIFGEAEESLEKLLRVLTYGGDHSKIEGLIFKKDKITIANEKTNYFQSPVLSLDDNLISFYWQNGGMLNIQTKRGCPYNCIYCTYPLIDGHKVRTLDPDQIVNTISDLFKTKKIDYFFFTDSIFNISNEFNYNLAERILAANLKIRWGAYFNFTNIDLKLLKTMKQAGLTHIEFGTDSLSETILQKSRKPFNVADVLRISKYCNQLEIDFAHFLILGGYGETDDTLNETFENSKKINRSVFFPFIGMRIYPGTRLHEIAIEENVVKINDPLLEPIYYVSSSIDLSSLKRRAKLTGKKWIFPMKIRLT